MFRCTTGQFISQKGLQSPHNMAVPFLRKKVLRLSTVITLMKRQNWALLSSVYK